jgi:hypothetical protein
MALNPALEELLKKLPKEAADQQRKILEAHPELGEGWMRQADYDRSMNEGKEKITAAEQERDKWKGWADRNVPKIEEQNKQWDAREAELKTLRDKVAAASSAAAAAAGGNGGGGDHSDIEAKVLDRVQKLGYATSTDIAKIAAEEAQKKVSEQLEQFNKTTGPGYIEFTLTAQDLQLQHFKEFGELLPRAELAKFMNEHKLNDPQQGYKQWIEPRRKQVAEEASKAAIKAEVDRQVAAELAKRNTPGSPMGTPLEMGPLNLRISKTDALGDKEVSLGDGQAAAAAAAELRSEGRV